MPRVSRRPITDTLDIELKDNFAYLISSLKNAREIENFFQDFLTHEEKIMLSKRIMLHMMLEKGYPSTKIEAIIGLSRETVRTHKSVWAKGGVVYKKVIKSMTLRHQTKAFWKSVEQALHPLSHALRSKTNMRARSKLMVKELDA